jgi:hypothetical protein
MDNRLVVSLTNCKARIWELSLWNADFLLFLQYYEFLGLIVEQ